MPCIIWLDRHVIRNAGRSVQQSMRQLARQRVALYREQLILGGTSAFVHDWLGWADWLGCSLCEQIPEKLAHTVLGRGIAALDGINACKNTSRKGCAGQPRHGSLEWMRQAASCCTHRLRGTGAARFASAELVQRGAASAYFTSRLPARLEMPRGFHPPPQNCSVALISANAASAGRVGSASGWIIYAQ